MHNTKTLFLICLIFLVSCISPVPDQLSVALDFAGENRSELEKVLDYFQDEELKYKAAYFFLTSSHSFR